MRKFMFKVSVPQGKKEPMVTKHDYFAETEQRAAEQLQVRFGPEATVTFQREIIK